MRASCCPGSASSATRSRVTPDALADTMSALGLAVEEVERVGAPVDGVIVAEVLALRAHPKADRIQLVDVDTGDGAAAADLLRRLQHGRRRPACRWPRSAPTMPGGLEIARRKLRGEWSNGMLCSPTELGLGDDHGGILVLPPDLPLGAPVFDALGVTSDVVFDLDLTRNRPDAWSHRGVARDVAAFTGVPFTDIAARPSSRRAQPSRRRSSSSTPCGCGRFTATVLTGSRCGRRHAGWPSGSTAPACGRSTTWSTSPTTSCSSWASPTTRTTSTGCPGGAFRVRRAAAGETMMTLDDVERTFTTDDLLICDGEDTPDRRRRRSWAAPRRRSTTARRRSRWRWRGSSRAASRRTAARLGLRSEASARFERGVDPYVIDAAIGRFVELLRETSPTVQVAPGAVDARGDPARARALTRVRTSRVERAARHRARPTTTSSGCSTRSASPSAPDRGPRRAAGRRSRHWRPDCRRGDRRHRGGGAPLRLRAHRQDRADVGPPGLAHAGASRTAGCVRQVMVGLGLAEAMPLPLLGPGDHARAGLAEDAIALDQPDGRRGEPVAHVAAAGPAAVAGLQRVAPQRRRRPVRARPRVPPCRPAAQPLPDERELLTAVRAGADAMVAADVVA